MPDVDVMLLLEEIFPDWFSILLSSFCFVLVLKNMKRT